MTHGIQGRTASGRDRDRTPAFSVATVGGTFNTLHAGHMDYLRVALAVSGFIHVSLTSDRYATALKSYQVRPFDVRHKEIESFLGSIAAAGRFELHRIDSEDQLAEFVLDAALDLAVVEPRYLEMFQELNSRRERLGAREYYILVKPRTRIRGVDVSSTALQEAGR